MTEKPIFYMRPEGGIPYLKPTFISHPDTGGTLSYIEGMSTPINGTFEISVIYSLDVLKRIIRNFAHFVGKNKLIIPFVFFNWKSLLKNFNEIAEVALRNHNIILEHYCKCTRELIRVGDKLFKNLDLLELFMVVVTFIEYDLAYRYRPQFALMLINKELFRKNPYKETKRVLEEMNRREGDTSVKGKYIIFKRLLWLLKIPNFKWFAIDFVEEMNMEQISFDENDKVWITFNKKTPESEPEFDFTQKQD